MSAATMMPTELRSSETARAWKTNRWLLLFLIVFQAAYLWNIGPRAGKFTDTPSEGWTIRSVGAYLKDGITSHYSLPRIHFGGTDPKYDPLEVQIDENGLMAESFRRGFPERLSTLDEWPYTHYPQGPNVILAVLARIFGFEHIWLLRIFPAVTGIIALALLFHKTAEVFGARTSIVLALALTLTPTIPLSLPALHYLSYTMTLVFLQMVVYMNWFWGGRSTVGSKVWLLMIGFIQGWLSFDFCFIITLLVVPFWLLKRAQDSAPSFAPVVWGMALPAFGFVIAHVLHFFQVAGELESVAAAWAEFRNTAAERGGVSEGGYISFLAKACYLTLRNAFSPKNLNFGPWLLFVLVTAALVGFFAQTRLSITRFRDLRQVHGVIQWPGARRILPVLAAAFFVSTVWIVVMPQHTAGNAHLTVRHLLVIYVFCVIAIGLSSRVEYGGESSAPEENGSFQHDSAHRPSLPIAI